MRKLRLELDALAVESFDTSAVPGLLRGTVHGLSQETTRDDDSIDTCQTGCQQSETCTVTEDTCADETWETCYGATCYGVSCGPAGSCSEGCWV